MTRRIRKDSFWLLVLLAVAIAILLTACVIVGDPTSDNRCYTSAEAYYSCRAEAAHERESQ